MRRPEPIEGTSDSTLTQQSSPELSEAHHLQSPVPDTQSQVGSKPSSPSSPPEVNQPEPNPFPALPESRISTPCLTHILGIPMAPMRNHTSVPSYLHGSPTTRCSSSLPPRSRLPKSRIHTISRRTRHHSQGLILVIVCVRKGVLHVRRT